MEISNIVYIIKTKVGIVPSYPLSVMIEPTNSCNLRCPACPTGSGKMTRPARTMSYEEFTTIIDQCEGHVKNLTLWNFGEPFLNKDILRMINYAHLAGMSVITSTNGHFFKSEKFCEEIINSGLHHLIICLDGADQDTISKYRKNAKFGEIVNGIRLMVSVKKRLKADKPKIEMQFILMKHNEYQRSYMREYATKLGVDIFVEKTVGIGPDRDDSDFQNLAKELLPSDLSLSRYELHNGIFEPKGKIINRCQLICRTMVINSDGSVSPCCYDESSKYVMGNVFEQDIRSIWKSSKYQEFRDLVRQNRKNMHPCNKCSESRHIDYDRLKILLKKRYSQ